jgi:2-polyprenyl-3-methyl-5-hydroxy-6-metoxy-1,4-benzoquinol methylase
MRCNLCATPVADGQAPRWHKHGYRIFRCRSCGLLFRGELPTPEDLLRIYSHAYFQRESKADAEGYDDYLSDGPEHRLTARRRVEELARRATVCGGLLDVGSAAGFFMDEARSAGWQVQGIDVSSDMSTWGRENLGLEIATGLFQQADYAAGSFDAVTMWDYIEHSIDPTLDFEKAAHVLRPGGVLMLSTGDAASLVARISGRRWHLLTPRHHNFFFTVATLRRYLEQSGFEVVWIGHPAAHYSLRYIVYKLRTMAPRSRSVHALGEWFARHSIGQRSLRLNLGDILTIHARRR